MPKIIELGTAEGVSKGADVGADGHPLDSTPQPAEFDAITSELRGEIIGILGDKLATASERGREIAALVVAALLQVGRLYFHAERCDFDTTMFFDAHRKRLERIRSDGFVAWLSDWLKINRADNVFKYVANGVETAALSGPHTTGIVPESYWASRPGAFYLSNGDGATVKITSSGVALVDNGTDDVLFAAGRTLAPWKLTEPKDPFETCAIFRNANFAAVHGRDLLRAYICSLPTNPPSKPPACFAGEVGSGKTRLAKGIAEFYGVPIVVNKVDEKKESDFWPCCNAGGIFTLDNADTKVKWLADAVANAATDGCSQRRKLYTDLETVKLSAHAWLILTTANPTFASDAGLADRLLPFRMNRRTDETSDAALTAEILANRDAGLSFIVHVLARALADSKPTPGGLNLRHPDFASFAVRIGRALGSEAETITALKNAEADKSAFCLENDYIVPVLLAYLRTVENFRGTAVELVPHLVELDAELSEKLSPKRLGKRLAALWPHLQKVLAIAGKEMDRKGITVFTLQAQKAKNEDPAGFAGLS